MTDTVVINTPEDYRCIHGRPPVMIQAGGMEIPCPCLQTMLVASGMVVANTWNPNSVPVDKMELLRQSILDNGFCFPIVTIWDDEQEVFVIVDGFHRHLMADKKWLSLTHVPVVVLNHSISQRMAATVQFNKARGIHQVDLDADVVRALLEQGLTEEDVSQHLGMDLDAVHRYKQLTGIAELFRKADYSVAWEMGDADSESATSP